MESRWDNRHIAPFDALPVVPADGPWTPPPHEFEPPRASRPPRPSTATLKVRYAAVRTAEDLRQAIVFAAREDDLHGLRWLLREFPKMPRDDPTPVERAAEHGHFETLKWLRARGWPFSPCAIGAAASEGRLEIVHWLRKDGNVWSGMSNYKQRVHPEYPNM